MYEINTKFIIDNVSIFVSTRSPVGRCTINSQTN